MATPQHCAPKFPWRISKHESYGPIPFARLTRAEALLPSFSLGPGETAQWTQHRSRQTTLGRQQAALRLPHSRMESSEDLHRQVLPLRLDRQEEDLALAIKE